MLYIPFREVTLSIRGSDSNGTENNDLAVAITVICAIGRHSLKNRL